MGPLHTAAAHNCWHLIRLSSSHAVAAPLRMVLWLGALCCFTGYIGLHLMATGKTDGGFAQLLLFAVAAGEWCQGHLHWVDHVLCIKHALPVNPDQAKHDAQHQVATLPTRQS